MADFEMRNFNNFPLEKSSYDLKLELLEELSPEEAMELMKANSEFRSIYLKDPWRIFGRHVHSIRSTRCDAIEICKLRESTALDCDSCHLPLLKKIKSCVKFDYGRCGWWIQQPIGTARKILSNLDSIEEWGYRIGDLESFQECFSIFKGQITDQIFMGLDWYSGKEDEPNLSIITKVFETQLGRCKKVYVYCCVNEFSIICQLFLNTRVKWIDFNFTSRKQFSVIGLEKAIRWIIQNGSPSQHREAWICIFFPFSAASHDFLENFFPTLHGMQQISHEDKDHRRYLRKIDDKGDCFFEWGKIGCRISLVAKYVEN